MFGRESGGGGNPDRQVVGALREIKPGWRDWLKKLFEQYKQAIKRLKAIKTDQFGLNSCFY